LTINLGGDGIALAGTLLPPKDLAEQVDWNFTEIQIEQMVGLPPPIPFPQELKDADKQAWLQQWMATPPGSAWMVATQVFQERNRERGRYVGAADDKGQFRIDDVPPGNYTFSMALHKSGAGIHGDRDQMIGKLDFQFQVPSATEGQASFDLGQLQVEPTGKK